MTFAIEVVATFDRDDPAYVVDVVSVVESVLEDPRQILAAQQNAAKGAEVARLKADGVPYEERMERLDAVTWPRPLAELLDTLFTTYRAHHPWLTTDPAPKSILREMLESGDTFATFVRRYRLERSEGLVLRYLTDAWRALDRSLARRRLHRHPRGRRRVARRADPGDRRDAARRVDAARRPPGPRPPRAGRPDGGPAVPAAGVAHRRAHRGVRLGRPARGPCVRRRSPSAAGGPRTTCVPRWRRTGTSTTPCAPTPTPARPRGSTSPRSPTRWVVTQRLLDPAGDAEWRFVATVDLEAARAEGAPTLRLEQLGRDLTSCPFYPGAARSDRFCGRSVTPVSPVDVGGR